jgi:hypothetical protein
MLPVRWHHLGANRCVSDSCVRPDGHLKFRKEENVMDVQPYEGVLVEVRKRYEDLVRHAAKFGISIPARIDPIGIQCDTGTACCAGDGKALDARDMVILPSEQILSRTVKEG